MKNVFYVLLCFIAVGTSQVAEKAEDISPLLIGEEMPSVEIISINGESESLSDIVARQRSVVLFYRGGWCPFCNMHLSAVGQLEKEIRELGYQVIAISPDSPEKLKSTMDKGKLKYALYSDSDGTLIKAMGLAFKARERQKEKLSNYSNNKNPGILPVPALFVIDIDGTILFEYISPKYKQRIKPDLLLSVLKHFSLEVD